MDKANCETQARCEQQMCTDSKPHYIYIYMYIIYILTVFKRTFARSSNCTVDLDTTDGVQLK